MKKERRQKYSSIHSEQLSKKFQIGKRQAIMAYMDTGFKKFTSIHDRMVIEMNRCSEETYSNRWQKERLPWYKKSPKWNRLPPNDYRPITCLPMMRQIRTAQISVEIYDSLLSCRLFPDDQNGCRKWTRVTGELLYTDQDILNECKTRLKNIAMARIDYIETCNWTSKAG